MGGIAEEDQQDEEKTLEEVAGGGRHARRKESRTPPMAPSTSLLDTPRCPQLIRYGTAMITTAHAGACCSCSSFLYWMFRCPVFIFLFGTAPKVLPTMVFSNVMELGHHISAILSRY
jgi:hypothetical protein